MFTRGMQGKAEDPPARLPGMPSRMPTLHQAPWGAQGEQKTLAVEVGQVGMKGPA